jgi:G6PDH family F420-dependent oxidoreductase
MSGFGKKSATLAGRIADGYISTMPDRELLQVFRDAGGAGKPAQAGYKVCWGSDDDARVKTAHRLWSNSRVPGELAQVLPSPRHFEQVSQLVTEDMTRDSIAYGAEKDRHVEAFRRFAESGYDEIYIAQMGGSAPESSAAGFFAFYHELLPSLSELAR